MTVTPYNFQKPGPLASALEQQFAGWLRSSCALVTRRWKKALPFAGELYFLGCDPFRAGDFLATLPEAVVGYRAMFQEKLPTLLVWPRPLVAAAVAGLMGDAPAELPEDRDLTVVEESLFEYLMKDLCFPSLGETWPGAAAVKLELGPKEPNVKWTRLFGPGESLIVATFMLRAPFGEHEWRWLWPKKGLLEHLGQAGSIEDPAVVRRRLETLVRDLPVELTVTLGTVELKLPDLAQLRAGDVILLNQRVSQPLTASLPGERKMRGWPGRLGGRQAFQVETLDD